MSPSPPPMQCGILQESVFSSSMSEKCRFRVVSIGDEAESGGSGGRTEGGGASMNPPQLGECVLGALQRLLWLP